MDINTSTRVTTLNKFNPAVTSTATVFTPSLRPSQYQMERGHWNADLVLSIRVPGEGYGHPVRYQFGYIDQTGKCRREHGGPITSGPYAYGFALGAAITSDPAMSTRAESERQKAAGIEHAAELGDWIRLGGEIFEIQHVKWKGLQLVHVASSI